MLKYLAALALVLSLGTHAAAQSTVFIVRHAERADAATADAKSMEADPDLSDAGRTRAESLAAMLRDAGLTAIFATEFKRTQQTAQPVAKTLKLGLITITSKEPDTLARRVKATKGNVLVVGHSNSIPDLLKALGIATPVKIGDSDYDNLFIVERGASPKLLHLHYR
jgi:broad specificity phosphatase PhoE